MTDMPIRTETKTTQTYIDPKAAFIDIACEAVRGSGFKEISYKEENGGIVVTAKKDGSLMRMSSPLREITMNSEVGAMHNLVAARLYVAMSDLQTNERRSDKR